jgi:hypothetical protein
LDGARSAIARLVMPSGLLTCHHHQSGTRVKGLGAASEKCWCTGSPRSGLRR